MLIVMEKASLSLLLVALVVVSLPLHTNAGKYKKGDRVSQEREFSWHSFEFPPHMHT